MSTIKKLDSGYWHFRVGASQFAQWPIGRVCVSSDFFRPEDATQHLVDEANAMAQMDVPR